MIWEYFHIDNLPDECTSTKLRVGNEIASFVVAILDIYIVSDQIYIYIPGQKHCLI